MIIVKSTNFTYRLLNKYFKKFFLIRKLFSYRTDYLRMTGLLNGQKKRQLRGCLSRCVFMLEKKHPRQKMSVLSAQFVCDSFQRRNYTLWRMTPIRHFRGISL